MIKKYHSQKYSLDQSFFDKWNPVMAYVLGFWYADGYMRHEKSYRITFYSKDKEILDKIRLVMKSGHSISKGPDECWNMTLFSKRLYNGLQCLGGTRRKSRSIRMPKIPTKLYADFIRGYFDGDGSVFFVHYNSTKNNKPRVELRSNFTSGSRPFLMQLMQVLKNQISLSKKVLGSYNNGGSLKLGYGTADTITLLRYLYYSNHKISLGRKAEFLKYINDFKLLK